VRRRRSPLIPDSHWIFAQFDAERCEPTDKVRLTKWL